MKLSTLLVLFVAAVSATPAAQSNNEARSIVKRWTAVDRREQLHCYNNGVKMAESLRDCDGKALTPKICSAQCSCWNGRVKCDGWSKCSPETMTQVCACKTRPDRDGQCDEPGVPCRCQKKGSFPSELDAVMDSNMYAGYAGVIEQWKTAT